MAPEVDSNRVAAAKKREAKVEFMRAYMVALASGGAGVSIETDAAVLARRAHWAWDAIEAEAAK